MVFSRSAVCSDGGGFPDLEVFEENAHVRFLRIIWYVSEQRIFRERSTCVCCARTQSIADKRLKVIRRDRTACTKTVVALSKQTICATLFLIGSILLLSSLRRVGARALLQGVEHWLLTTGVSLLVVMLFLPSHFAKCEGRK